MELFWWVTTLVLIALGLIGTILPAFPGTALIFGATVLHRFMLGPEKGLGWPSLLLLFLLMLVSFGIDFLGGWLGAQRFGATRWEHGARSSARLVGLFLDWPVCSSDRS